MIGKDNASLGRILQANGYATAWFGKDHNVPLWEATPAGPKDQWPAGMGFDYFYGFIGGDMDQWHPTLYENLNQIFPEYGHPHYNLNIDLADKATSWLKQINDLKPAQPVFMYYCPGGTHAPHQPTPEWIAKMKGKFDMGWDAYQGDGIQAAASAGHHSQKRKAHARGPIPNLRITRRGLLRHQPAALEHPYALSEEGVRPRNGSLRRLSGRDGLRDRSHYSSAQGHGSLQQHADLLHSRR